MFQSFGSHLIQILGEEMVWRGSVLGRGGSCDRPGAKRM